MTDQRRTPADADVDVPHTPGRRRLRRAQAPQAARPAAADRRHRPRQGQVARAPSGCSCARGRAATAAASSSSSSPASGRSARRRPPRALGGIDWEKMGDGWTWISRDLDESADLRPRGLGGRQAAHRRGALRVPAARRAHLPDQVRLDRRGRRRRDAARPARLPARRRHRPRRAAGADRRRRPRQRGRQGQAPDGRRASAPSRGSSGEPVLVILDGAPEPLRRRPDRRSSARARRRSTRSARAGAVGRVAHDAGRLRAGQRDRASRAARRAARARRSAAGAIEAAAAGRRRARAGARAWRVDLRHRDGAPRLRGRGRVRRCPLLARARCPTTRVAPLRGHRAARRRRAAPGAARACAGAATSTSGPTARALEPVLDDAHDRRSAGRARRRASRRLLGARVVVPAGATGDVDTDLARQGDAAALRALRATATTSSSTSAAPTRPPTAATRAAKRAALERVDARARRPAARRRARPARRRSRVYRRPRHVPAHRAATTPRRCRSRSPGPASRASGTAPPHRARRRAARRSSPRRGSALAARRRPRDPAPRHRRHELGRGQDDGRHRAASPRCAARGVRVHGRQGRPRLHRPELPRARLRPPRAATSTPSSAAPS